MTESARIVMLEAQKIVLESYLFDTPGLEGAAFLICGQAAGGTPKLVCHAVIPLQSTDYLERRHDGLTIGSGSLTRIAKLAREEGMCIVFAHSHPDGITEFSSKDDEEEAKLLPFLQARAPGRIHGTMVVTKTSMGARLYAPRRIPASVLVVGDRFRLYSAETDDCVPQVYDRQVRAFGRDTQQTLSALHVGVVGLGGTGSPIAEQLVRLGVGRITLFDGDRLERTNVNRVYGSSLSQTGRPKVEIAKEHLDRIGLDAHVVAVAHHITEESAAKRLRDCDIIFGCTDKQIPRAILMQVALRYCLPVFDLGVLIDSKDGEIRSIHGRITTLMPGESCLYCRGRISAEAMRIEALSPQEREQQAREGYAPELDTTAPAVIAFTSTVASLAVSELLNRLTGFMGSDRKSSEVLIAFDQSRIRTNRVAPRDACHCADHAQWCIGDENPYLGLAWPTLPS
ncbi:ThiF family adenylyltransferase [Lysobacter solisilvae (ex Woo and Kim 2020)]|uniref:ThiF family adenylyltransferase n=1 Tax=Agrilutibacter terrestris TaxID=2865112 RepID=A0A7H0G0B4_9GAMM|nr:ThiF family adenylyltransferase [Lysobacter terrestris]QNP41730.1 ThiF family adenylyltransferase [Lysobacter terrestris]